jgi:hypothetical protein
MGYKVVSPFIPHHGDRVARMLGKELSEVEAGANHYMVGFYREGDVPESIVIKSPCVIHWTGSDISHALYRYSNKALGPWAHHLNKPWIKHLVQTMDGLQELKMLDIESKIVPIPPEFMPEVCALPDEFSVGVYLPVNGDRDLYQFDSVKIIAEVLPNIKFKVCGVDSIEGWAPNVEFYGWVDMKEFIKEVSVWLRLTTHDGLPQGCLEAMLAGRRVVFNHSLRGIYYVGRGCQLNNIVDMITQLSRIDQPDVDFAKAWREELDHGSFKQQIEKQMELAIGGLSE